MTAMVMIMLAFLLSLWMPATPQSNAPLPNTAYLYLSNTAIYGVEPKTGEIFLLPDSERGTTSAHQFVASPNGCYILRYTLDRKTPYALYDVAQTKWIEESSLNGSSPAIASDGLHIAYVVSAADYSASLHIYNRETATDEIIYATPPGEMVFPYHISMIGWSPTGTHLLFRPSKEIMGRSLISTVLYAMDTGEWRYLFGTDEVGGSQFVWSPDGNWLLMQYFGDSLYRADLIAQDPNEQGDLYLYHLPTLESYRVTATPQNREYFWRFSADGDSIIFHETDDHALSVRIEDVIANTPTVTEEAIPTEAIPASHVGWYYPNYTAQRAAFVGINSLAIAGLDGTNPKDVEQPLISNGLGWLTDASAC